jgi:hypothetical protein
MGDFVIWRSIGKNEIFHIGIYLGKVDGRTWFWQCGSLASWGTGLSELLFELPPLKGQPKMPVVFNQPWSFFSIMPMDCGKFGDGEARFYKLPWGV